MEMNFCRRCGTKLTQKTEGAFSCGNGHTLFINAAPAASVFFVTDDNQVLLSIRGIEPYKGMLDSIGGFVDEGESLEDAAVREIKEELGLERDDYEHLQFLCSYPSKCLYDGEDRSILGSFFWTKLKPGAQPLAADDVADIRFLPLNDIDMTEIGNGDVKSALKKLQELML